MPSKIILTELTCDDCGVKQFIKCVTRRDYSHWCCRSCSIKRKWADPQYRSHRKPKKKSQRAKQGSIEHRAKMSAISIGRQLSDSHKAAISAAVRKMWCKTEYRNKMTKIIQSDESRKLRSTKSKKMWTSEFRAKYQTIEHRQKKSAISAALWRLPSYRNKVLASKSTTVHKELMRKIQTDPEYIRKLSIAYSKLPHVSSLQHTLYKILDDLGVQYYGEVRDADKCVIGPWSFDCVIPGAKTILIECQGDWIHSFKHKRAADVAKATYMRRYFGHSHSIKYLWEHQFAAYNCVVNLIKTWLGIESHTQTNFQFSDVCVRICPATEYRPFLAAYHYLDNAGRGGIAFGAYIADVLAAVCVFSPVPRQNIIIDGYSTNELRDLSRLCIHPAYQKKNFASWFISRCIKSLDIKYRLIIAYADSTFNHFGTAYRASNFAFDGYTIPDYWYSSNDGWVMHKKTLYNRATNLKLTENEYAIQFNMRKVYGYRKSRFIFRR